MDFYQVIHNSFLLELMRNTICIGCKEKWNGKVHISKREICLNDFAVDSGLIWLVIEKLFIFFFFLHLGLSCSLIFTCE